MYIVLHNVISSNTVYMYKLVASTFPSWLHNGIFRSTLSCHVLSMSSVTEIVSASFFQIHMWFLFQSQKAFITNIILCYPEQEPVQSLGQQLLELYQRSPTLWSIYDWTIFDILWSQQDLLLHIHSFHHGQNTLFFH